MSEIKCTNCKYYVQHYVLTGTHFIKVPRHCKREEMMEKFRFAQELYIDDCPLWEPVETGDRDKKVIIGNVIDQMNNRLWELMEYLKVKE